MHFYEETMQMDRHAKLFDFYSMSMKYKSHNFNKQNDIYILRKYGFDQTHEMIKI